MQGVGFRFTALGIAGELKVTGWVKNLPGGEVEVLAEAEEVVLQEFLARLDKVFFGYITNVEVNWLAASGEYRDFAVRS